MGNKAVIFKTGEIVTVYYDDDDLYKVSGRAEWLYRNEFRYIEDDELLISYANLRKVLVDLDVDNNLIQEILDKVKEYE